MLVGGCRAGQCRWRGRKTQGLDKEGLDLRDGKSLREGSCLLDSVSKYADIHRRVLLACGENADHQSIVFIRLGSREKQAYIETNR